MEKDEIEKYLNQRRTYIGTAKDAKSGAVLVTEFDNPIYIEGLDSWPQKLLDKQVSVMGVLKLEKFIPDPVIDENGAISQGAKGLQLVLKEAKIKK